MSHYPAIAALHPVNGVAMLLVAIAIAIARSAWPDWPAPPASDAVRSDREAVS